MPSDSEARGVVSSTAIQSHSWRQLWRPILAMILVVVASNWLVQYPINAWLTWGAFTYPLAFLVNDLTNRGASRFYKGCVRLNLDLLRYLPNLQRSIDDRTAVYLQHNSGLHVGAKARQCRFQPVRTQWQI